MLKLICVVFVSLSPLCCGKLNDRLPENASKEIISATDKLQRDYPFEPVPFTAVHFNDVFWSPRMEINRTVTIPYAFEKCKDSKRFYNFERAAKRLAGEQLDDTQPPGLTFDDTDPYKVLEGASFGLSVKYDADMDAYLDKIIELIASAQEPDGYLYTARTMQPYPPHDWAGNKRWVNVKNLSHELYNMGHLYEAAVAHYHATGKVNLLDVAIKNADLLCETFGPGKNEDAPGHQIIEMGLVRLYRVTGNEKYLNLAKFFLDTRGPNDGEYSQAHKKVIDQDEAIGHAVRATYMYCGMADVAAIKGEQTYIDALSKIWENTVTKKMYITGGIGSTSHGEAFGKNYQLPNMSAYCETCAAIGNVYWNHRMFLLHGESKYIDVMERVLYNGLISGISIEGKDFFYPNPLESRGQHKRSPWFGCACCPGNIARFLASVPGYAYARKDDKIYVNLFVGSTARIDMDGEIVQINQHTRYPWDGDIKMTILPEKDVDFTLCVRIPGWAGNMPVPGDLYGYQNKVKEFATLKLNGKMVALKLIDGYVHLSRKWEQGDTVELNLPMPIRKVIANEKVQADKNRFSIERGPVVYCIEGVDQSGGRVRNLFVSPEAKLATAYNSNLLGGVQVITGDAFLAGRKADSGEAQIKKTVAFTAVPYCVWCNRGANEMVVWLPTKIEDTVLAPRRTIASQSKVTTSKGTGSLSNMINQIEPKDSSDKENGMFHWWPKKGTQEWVQFDFDKPTILSSIEVYWLDDTGSGQCRVPQNWKLMYKNGSQWSQVIDGNGFAVEKDMFNRTSFAKITTNSVRLEVQFQEGWSGGVLEVKFDD
ncbi:MAG: glycoside hydrolase family 127 protein [Phycisphaerae bacterium]|nr:glycoside hydrolase family 127 protein [Phycisphaerae bacterium]